MSRALRVMGPPVVVLLASLLLWQVVIWVFKPSAFLLPSPGAVATAAWEGRAEFAAALAQTAGAACAGFLLAAFLGVAAGSVLSASTFLLRGFYPLATLLQMVPLVAIAPLLVIWCGPGQRTAVASAVIVSIFPVLAATLDGLRSTDHKLVELFNTLGASRAQRWWKLELPAAVPSVVTGLRIAAGLAVIGAVVGEFVGAYAGADEPLGMKIITAMRESRTERVFAAVALAAVVGFALFGLVSSVGWLLLRRWHSAAG